LWLKVVLLILKQPKQVQFVDNNNGDPQGAQAYLAQHGSTTGWGLKEGGSVRKQNGHCKTGDFLTMSVLVDICDPIIITFDHVSASINSSIPLQGSRH
jgi:hypothetical protein